MEEGKKSYKIFQSTNTFFTKYFKVQTPSLQSISEYKHLVIKYFRVQTPFLQNISEYKHLFYKIFQSTNTLFTKYFRVQTPCLQNISKYKHLVYKIVSEIFLATNIKPKNLVF